MLKPASTFALLDDATAPAGARSSRFYADPLECITCMRAQDVAGCFARVDEALAGGSHALGLFDYEL